MKNLENEYKELVNKDIPDLWDRIEAGLEEKNVSVEETIIDDNSNDHNQGKIVTNINWQKVIKNGGLVAAACLLLLVGGPMVVNRLDKSKYASQAPAAAESIYVAENAMDAECEEAVESPQMNAMDLQQEVKVESFDLNKKDTMSEEYFVGVEIVETQPVIKAKVIKVSSAGALVNIDDMITLVGVEDIVESVQVGNEYDFIIEPVSNSDNELEFRVVAK